MLHLRKRLIITLACALVLAWLTLIAPRPAAVAGTPSCDLAEAMNARLDQLGRGGYGWSVEPAPINDANGSAYTNWGTQRVVLSSKLPCSLVDTAVDHELIHVWQGNKFPDVIGAYGDMSVERVADCGAMLLGATWTPYIDADGRGCDAAELIEARSLVASGMMPQ
jgi:hypothetical protein